MKKPFFLHVVFATLILAGLSGCSVSRKIDKWVGRHYGETVPTKFKTTDFVTFTLENPLPADKVSRTEKTNNQWVPAVFYWQWKYETTSTLNVMLPMNTFANSFIAETNAKKLKDRVNGAKLTVTLQANPSDFRYHDNGWLVYLLLGYVSKSKIYVEPQQEQFSVKYTLTQTSGEVATGTVNVTNPNKEKAPRMFQSLRGAVREYLTLSDENVRGMAKELADKIIVELAAEGLVKN